MIELTCADVVKWATEYDGPQFHALLADAPYEYGFMGKSWDASGVSFQADTWAALAEHLLPGAFGMTFGGARTWHRIACAIEDAGLRIHPSIFGWVYGSGFPKATRLDTQIDATAGVERTGTGKRHRRNVKPFDDNAGWNANSTVGDYEYTAPATALAQTWAGHRYGLQALKPALEPVIVFQKPYDGKPVESIVSHGAGTLNVDGARIAHDEECKPIKVQDTGHDLFYRRAGRYADTAELKPNGRWPANFALSHHPDCVKRGTRRVKTGTIGSRGKGAIFGSCSEQQGGHDYADADGMETIADWDCVPSCPVRRLGEQSGHLKSNRAPSSGFVRTTDKQRNVYAPFAGQTIEPTTLHGDDGTAARFFYQADWTAEIAERLAQVDPVFYCPKASRSEREAGLENLPTRTRHRVNPGGLENEPRWAPIERKNVHPTVKPIALSRWLASLLLPPKAYVPRRIVVPFAGVASEMIGAFQAGWEDVVGVELVERHVEIGRARIRNQTTLLLNLEGAGT